MTFRGFTVLKDELLRKGIRLFNNCEFFQCHEVLEEAWMPERGPRRLFLEALIHRAVGLYHSPRPKIKGIHPRAEPWTPIPLLRD